MSHASLFAFSFGYGNGNVANSTIGTGSTIGTDNEVTQTNNAIAYAPGDVIYQGNFSQNGLQIGSGNGVLAFFNDFWH
jgi:hypothetical protein